jgi:hypothetical protein
MARSPIPIAIPGRGRSGIFREYAIVRFSEWFEAIATAQRADEPLPKGRLGVTRYRAVHKHLLMFSNGRDIFELSR